MTPLSGTTDTRRLAAVRQAAESASPARSQLSDSSWVLRIDGA
jgi:hypothetical protein